MEEVEEAKQKSDYFVSILEKVCDIKLYRYRGRMKTGLGDQAMDSHYVNVDSVTLPSSNSIVFLNCIYQLYYSLDQQAMESHYVNVDSVTRRSPIHPS